MPFPNETKLFPYKRKSTAFPCVIQMTIGRLRPAVGAVISGWAEACPEFMARQNAETEYFKNYLIKTIKYLLAFA